LATDCNPGSSYLTSMPIAISIAIREMNLIPMEALYAATRGGATALQREDLGHLSIGATANLVIWDAPSYLHIPYRMGVISNRVITN
jgi:imidazolonepropionase